MPTVPVRPATSAAAENAAPFSRTAGACAAPTGHSTAAAQCARPRRAVLTDVTNRSGGHGPAARATACRGSVPSTSSADCGARASRPHAVPRAPVTSSTTSSRPLSASTESKLADLPSNVARLSLAGSSEDTHEFEVDARDAANPLCAVEYVKEMYQHYRKVEGVRVPSDTYMSRQSDISPKMRAILLDWLNEVHLKFRFTMPTMYLTANLIDRFLSHKIVLRGKLQLVGVTCMLIASKYEETCAPEVEDFVYLTDRAYTAEEILATESSILNTLNFQLTVPTPWVFLARFVKLADMVAPEPQLLARYYCERMLQEYQLLRYLPSMVAAAAVYVAGSVAAGSLAWSPTLERGTKYSVADLRDCVADMVAIIADSDRTSLQAVRKKYSSSKYMRVARMPLPDCLLRLRS